MPVRRVTRCDTPAPSNLSNIGRPADRPPGRRPARRPVAHWRSTGRQSLLVYPLAEHHPLAASVVSKGSPERIT